MKKVFAIILGISLMVWGTGCGKDESPKEPEKTTDRIEDIGDSASKLGYDGEKLKKNLRTVQDLQQKQDKELEETLGE